MAWGVNNRLFCNLVINFSLTGLEDYWVLIGFRTSRLLPSGTLTGCYGRLWGVMMGFPACNLVCYGP